MKGRKPKTSEQKALDGNPGKRGLTIVPKARVGDSYPAPAFLHEYAREEWERLEPELRAIAVLTVADLAAFAGYCSAVGVARLAEEGLAKSKGSVKRRAFWIGSARKAWEEVRKSAAEFGLTPVSRTRLGKPAGEGKVDPLEAAIGRKRFQPGVA